MARSVLFLGAAGTGKTALITTLFKSVSHLRQAQIGGSDVSVLAKNIAEMENGSPSPTDPQSYYSFTMSCKLPILFPTPNDLIRLEFNLDSITYFDYSGVWLEVTDRDRNSIANRKLIDRICNSDAIFGCIDGDTILGVTRLTSTTRRIHKREKLLYHELPIIFTAMMQSIKVPDLHFVITKWDILQEAGISLGVVRRILLEIREFRDFVESMTPHIPWIIPVVALWQIPKSKKIEVLKEANTQVKRDITNPFSAWLLLGFCSDSTGLQQLEKAIRSIPKDFRDNRPIALPILSNKTS